MELSPSARAEIVSEYLHRLGTMDSPLLATDHARSLAIAQANAVLDDVLGPAAATGAAGPDAVAVLEGAGQDRLTMTVGNSRAAQGIHPANSLDAAVVLFEVALAGFVRVNAEGSAIAAVATALHRAIMQRVALAAVPYVAFLIARLRGSHLAERQRVARELHDRAAHGIGVGLHSLELFRYYTDNDPPRAPAKLDMAEALLREALESIRSLSADLRQRVGESGLAHALNSYLAGNVPLTVRHRMSVEGDVSLLPTDIAEELYLIMREATRNAVLHSGMTELVLCVEVSNHAATGTVTDNGRGFDPPPEQPAEGGLASMTERAELLGGQLRLSSSPGGGTVVSAIVPLPPTRR